jgi:hypothetical protein
MVSPISAVPARRVVRHLRIADVVQDVVRSWWAGWVRFASQMRDGVK